MHVLINNMQTITALHCVLLCEFIAKAQNWGQPTENCVLAVQPKSAERHDINL